MYVFVKMLTVKRAFPLSPKEHSLQSQYPAKIYTQMKLSGRLLIFLV